MGLCPSSEDEDSNKTQDNNATTGATYVDNTHRLDAVHSVCNPAQRQQHPALHTGVVNTVAQHSKPGYLLSGGEDGKVDFH